MLKLRQILFSRLALAVVAVVAGVAAAGCGQKGALYLPTEPAAAQRATLPEVLTPNRTRDAAGSSQSTQPAPVTSPTR
jgi:predicted small lipoprotein YifL